MNSKYNSSVLNVREFISPNYSRLGLAYKSINLLADSLFGREIKALVHEGNISSQMLFEKLGFTNSSISGLFLEYRKDV